MREVSIQQAQGLVGQSLGVSDWVTIDQDMINQFADLTGDHQFIHVDPERAKETPFGGTIAHGFLTLSMVASMTPDDTFTLEGMTHGVNYGFEKIRFLQHVPSGSKVRSRHALEAFEENGDGRYRIATEVTIEIDGFEKPALIANWITMQFV